MRKYIIFQTLLVLLIACGRTPYTDTVCEPTPYDEIGPFYRPGAPVRSKVGSGYILKGHVLSNKNCKPLANSKIEFWLVNLEGQYDDAHRATVYTNKKGEYQFESNRPTDYVGRLPHIHMMIHAEGHEQLITQHYPEKETIDAQFDLILSQITSNQK